MSDRDRRRLVEMLENHELTVRLRLADAVVEAARETKPFPTHHYDMDGYPVCDQCGRARKTREPWIVHADDCPGIALRDALAALDAYLEQAHDTAESDHKAATARERGDS